MVHAECSKLLNSKAVISTLVFTTRVQCTVHSTVCCNCSLSYSTLERWSVLSFELFGYILHDQRNGYRLQSAGSGHNVSEEICKFCELN